MATWIMIGVLLADIILLIIFYIVSRKRKK